MAGENCDPAKELVEHQILPAENIALTDPATFERRKMSCRNIIDMHDV